VKRMLAVSISGLLLLSSAIYARESVGGYSIKEALDLEQAKSTLGDSIRFYFGDQSHPEILKTFGEFRTNKKTNAFNKSDKKACQWVFLSAMVALKERAAAEGGNAVINIKSNYKNNLTSSEDEFQCGAGNVVAGVALVGTVVEIEK